MDDSIKNAIKFISAELKSDPQADRAKLIETASQKFDLTPLQADFLLNQYLT